MAEDQKSEKKERWNSNSNIEPG